MYIVTGGSGFIGSAFVSALNQRGIEDILVVDELATSSKWKNIRGKSFIDYLHKDDLLKAIVQETLPKAIKAIVHLGACSATTETDVDYLMRNNYQYSRTLLEYAVSNKIRFIYASSAATYGDGALGYSDAPESTPQLLPLNPYGYSKQIFDLFVLRSGLLSKVVGLKYFNVYGPNEYHKGDQRSMVHKAYYQIKSTGRVELFKSHRNDYKDGEQKRDFIYIRDCLEVMLWLLDSPQVNGIFNLGTGIARSWNDLAAAIYSALDQPPAIEYIEMPLSIRSQYQYFTQAEMTRLRQAGCPVHFLTLEQGVKDYITNYLDQGERYF
jgi:ADP-L-glycero-D-manno-heptose 6-epimerase